MQEGASVALVGANGAGKTNLLEAISLLTPGRGLRRSTLADLDNAQDRLCWSVSALVSGQPGEVRLGTGRDPNAAEEGNKRIVRIDGKNAKSQLELGQYFSALWLTPQMDNLFIEGGAARRKFIDRLVYSFDDEHATRINAYETSMRERNRLLTVRGSDSRWLTALEHKMAEKAIAIASAREHAVQGISLVMRESDYPFPKATIVLSGKVETDIQQHSALQAEERFAQALYESRTQDAQAGRALAGVHRTQIDVTHAEKKMVAERCSTGEQKALLVAIILAQATACAHWHGRVPVLLLDEVSTHLDANRRTALYDALKSLRAQCWLTATDYSIFDGLDAKFVAVNNGQLSPL